MFLFNTLLRWRLRRSILSWWSTSTTPRGCFHLFLANNCSTQLAHRLGGHEAAAIALYWLEEASDSGLHFDQAGLDYMVIILMSSLGLS